MESFIFAVNLNLEDRVALAYRHRGVGAYCTCRRGVDMEGKTWVDRN